uniref:Uncharacterized protein n=1 Tax=Romanomermis culicivorax TaxID=13658 RepID=A0A915ICQ8_ROMCU
METYSRLETTLFIIRYDDVECRTTEPENWPKTLKIRDKADGTTEIRLEELQQEDMKLAKILNNSENGENSEFYIELGCSGWKNKNCDAQDQSYSAGINTLCEPMGLLKPKDFDFNKVTEELQICHLFRYMLHMEQDPKDMKPVPPNYKQQDYVNQLQINKEQLDCFQQV